jgi:hypothetical protein
VYESQYIDQVQAQTELQDKIDKYENSLLKSVIVCKDEETLIVTQHIPTDFNVSNNLARNTIEKSLIIQPYYVQ